ncbi:MAG: DNA mismatch endonuclease Vsr [Candidatus Acidiferrales bacterium]
MALHWSKTDYSKRLSGRVSRDTQPELVLRKAIFALGMRYRIDAAVAPRTKADIVFPACRVAVFVDGCFWHGCPIHGRRAFQGPNADSWKIKMRRNTDRDRRNTRQATKAGWKVLRFWECEVLESPERYAQKVALQVQKRLAKKT